MKLTIASSAGFCFGVSRAVRLTEETLSSARAGERCWCLGELIHNSDETARLESLGLMTAERAQEIPDRSVVIIRSHGVPRREQDSLAARGCRLVDATCPWVARIHRIVSNASRNGERVFVIGQPEHPEVLGICGWCEGAEVLPDGEALLSRFQSEPALAEQPCTVVFQTTTNRGKIEQSINSFKKCYTNAKIFDTICDATQIRQLQARALSRQCGAMVVVGGAHSANSLHLAEICAERCPHVCFVSRADELDTACLAAIAHVGLTAGASTPAWIIKEVVNKMSDEIEILETTEQPAEQAAAQETAPAVETAPVEETPVVEAAPAEEAPVPEGEKSFDQLLEESIQTIHNGDTVVGTVAAITGTEVTLALPTKHSGYISASEFTNDEPGVSITDVLHIGDEVTASVVRVNDNEGTVQLSKRRLDSARSWEEIEAAHEAGSVIEGKVSEENKGGVVVNLKGIRVFIPASQTGLPRNEPMTSLVGQTVRFRLTEINRARKRVVGSIRSVSYRERKEKAEKIWAEIEQGKVYQGTVKSLTSYGAFVDIGGVDGMVHVSEMSWGRIRTPADVVSVGDEIEVFVLSFDPEKKKISLGHRKPEDNPWAKFVAQYSVGDVATVKVVKMMTFGAFAEVMPGVDGLIHISQIANRRIARPEEVLTVGQEVEAKITAIDTDKQKISLSIRALLEPEAAPAREQSEEREERRERRERKPEADALVYEISSDGTATGLAPEEDELVEE